MKQKIPEKWGDVADLMYKLKLEATQVAAKLEASPLAKKLAKIKEYANVLEEHVIENMAKSSGESAGGKMATVEVVTKPIPQIEDAKGDGWGKFYEYVRKNKAYHLLPRSIDRKAVGEELELRGKKGIPGITIFNAVSVSLRKKPETKRSKK